MNGYSVVRDSLRRATTSKVVVRLSSEPCCKVKFFFLKTKTWIEKERGFAHLIQGRGHCRPAGPRDDDDTPRSSQLIPNSVRSVTTSTSHPSTSRSTLHILSCSRNYPLKVWQVIKVSAFFEKILPLGIRYCLHVHCCVGAPLLSGWPYS